jgi:hypothetical protein
MIEVAARRLSPEAFVAWHRSLAGAADLDQAAAITCEAVGLPLSESDARIAREVRASLALVGDKL